MLSCDMCGLVFVSENDLDFHAEQVHIEPEVFVCNRCNFATQSNDVLKQHVHDDHGFTSRYFYSNNRKKSTSVPSDQPRKYERNVTSKPTAETKDKENVKKQGSITEGKLKCNTCNDSFNFRDEFDLHTEYFHATQSKKSLY